MDTALLISWIPKLATSLLVLLGITIIFEVKNLWKKDKQNAPKPVDQPILPESIQQFSTMTPDPAHQPANTRKTPVLLLLVPVLVIFLFVAVHLISSLPTNISPVVSPTPTPTPIPEVPATTTAPSIVIYRKGEGATLEVIPHDQLNRLTPLTEIYIAAKADSLVTRVEFTINDTVYPADINQRTPSGEVYLTYTIQEGVTNYHIAVRAE